MNLTLETLGVLHRAGNHRKQRIVLAATDVLTGMEMRAALANENLARVNNLTGKTLAAKTLRVGITAVTTGSEAFLVCHKSSAPFATLRW